MAKRVKQSAIAVPQTRADFEARAAELGDAMRRVDRAGSEAADKIAAVKLALTGEIAEDNARIKTLWAVVSAYAEAHRAELLPKDRKSIALASGVIGWRLGNPAVVIDGDEDEIIVQLNAMGLERFLREITEIDKPALLAEPAAVAHIAGISIRQKEALFFQPLDVKTEKTTTAKTVAIGSEVAA